MIKTAQNFQLETTDSDFLGRTTVAEETTAGLKTAAVKLKSQRISLISAQIKGSGDKLVGWYKLSLARRMHLLSTSYLHLRLLGYADHQIVSATSLGGTRPEDIMVANHMYAVKRKGTDVNLLGVVSFRTANTFHRNRAVDNYYLEPNQLKPVTTSVGRATTAYVAWAEKTNKKETEAPIVYGLYCELNEAYASHVTHFTLDRRWPAAEVASVLNKHLAAHYKSSRLIGHLVWKPVAVDGGGSVVELGVEDPKRKLDTTLEISFQGEIRDYLNLVSKQLVSPERAGGLDSNSRSKITPLSSTPPPTPSRLQTDVLGDNSEAHFGSGDDYPMRIGCSPTSVNTFDNLRGKSSSAGLLLKNPSCAGGLEVRFARALEFPLPTGYQTFSLNFSLSDGAPVVFAEKLIFRAILTVN
jgi:hypothetical protein